MGGLARRDLHAIVILFARDAAERERCQGKHDKQRTAAAPAARELDGQGLAPR